MLIFDFFLSPFYTFIYYFQELLVRKHHSYSDASEILIILPLVDFRRENLDGFHISASLLRPVGIGPLLAVTG